MLQSPAKKGVRVPDVQGSAFFPRSEIPHASDQILVGRAVHGDIRAFEVLMRRYGPLMRAYETHLLGANSEVDDVIQDTFITAWAKLPNPENPALAKSWLMSIARHKSIDRLRADRRHAPADDLNFPAPEHHTPARLLEARSARETLSHVLINLSENQRRCWELKELGDYTYSEIAEELNLPVSTVRGLLARVRKTLMREMEAWR